MRSSKGFTLIELLVAVIIAGIASIVIAPSIQKYSRASTLNNAAREFVSVLQYARNEAIRINATVSIETQNNTADEFTGELWVCRGTAACQEEEVLKVFDIAKGNVRFNSSVNTRISFNSRGRLTGNNNGQNILIGVCDAEEDDLTRAKKFITITPTGRTALENFDIDAGVHTCEP